MNMYDYIDEYGMYSFDEIPFNEIDATLFSFLSYVDYGKIVEKEKVQLKNVGRMHLGLHNKKERNIRAVEDATNLLKYIKDTARYKNCYLFNYEYDIENDIQFSVISIEYQPNKVFVSYEGTDEQISGWKENVILGFEFPTLTHKKAIEYLKKNYTFTKKRLIVGGHSKGGNLALVASMCSNFLVKHHIDKIYNMDGPGLLKKEFDSRSFKNIQKKYIHIIPENSIVGILLYSTNQKYIKSNVVGPLAHDILYWVIQDTKFVESKLTSFSNELHQNIIKYIDNHNKNDFQETVDNLYNISKKVDINTLMEIKNSKKIMAFIKECKSLNQSSRNMVYDLIGTILQSIGYSKYTDFINFMKKQNQKKKKEEI